MKYMSQFGIILAVTCTGEIMKFILPFPVPASIYGLVLMLVLLITKVIKIDQVKDVGEFLVEIMPLMFIPAAVGLLVSYKDLEGVLLPILFITIATTILVMIVAGHVTQLIMRRKKEKKK